MLLSQKLVVDVACAALFFAQCSCGSSDDSTPSNNPATDAGLPDAVQTDDAQTEAESDAAQSDVWGPDALPADAGEISQAEYPAAMASAVCDNIDACCAAHGYQNNATMCHDQILATYQDLMDAVAHLDGVTYDAKAAADCLAQQKAYVLKCVPDQADIDALQAVCGKVVVGAGQNGQSCTDSLQCAGAATGSSECNDESDADGGSYRICEPVSTKLPRGSTGSACNESCRVMTGSHATCERVGEYVEAQAACWVEDGLRCDAVAHQCVAVQSVGLTCTGDTDCEASAYCGAGVCTALPADGQACDPDVPIQCNTQSHCDSSSAVCVPNKKTGDVCTESLECESWQCHGGTCQPLNLIAPYFCIES